MWCRKTLDVLIYFITEPGSCSADLNISTLMVAKNIFDGIVLLLYGHIVFSWIFGKSIKHIQDIRKNTQYQEIADPLPNTFLQKLDV